MFGIPPSLPNTPFSPQIPWVFGVTAAGEGSPAGFGAGEVMEALPGPVLPRSPAGLWGLAGG